MRQKAMRGVNLAEQLVSLTTQILDLFLVDPDQFLDPGKLRLKSGKYQSTPNGLHRKPVAFVFGAEYRDAFGMANKRAAAARDRRSRDRRPSIPATPVRW